MKHRLFEIIGITLLILGYTPLPVAAAGLPAYIRFVHAASQAPNLALTVNNHVIFDDTEFTNVTAYQTITVGNTRFQLRQQGDTAQQMPVLETTLAAGQYYTVAAIGDVGSKKPILLRDTAQTPPTDAAIVQLYHLSPDAPAIDLREQKQRPVIANVAFAHASSAYTMQPGQYQFQVTPTTVAAPVLVQLTSKVEQGQIYHVFVIDNLVTIRSIVVPVTFPGSAIVPSELPRTSGDNWFGWLVLLGVVMLLVGNIVSKSISSRR